MSEGGPSGFELDGIHQHPTNALLEHPELLLIVGGFGILLAFVSTQICSGQVYPSRCTSQLELLGFGIAAVGLTAYVIFRLHRFDTEGE